MEKILTQFKLKTKITDIKPLKIGHINDSFILTGENPNDESYFLQRINHNIFKNVEGLQNNIRIVTDHLRKKHREAGATNIEQKVLQLIETKDNKLFYKDDEGNSFCPLCVENLEKSSESINENVVEEDSTVQKSNIHRKRRQRKLF